MLTQLCDETYENFLSQLSKGDAVDLRYVTFMDPYGMIGVLEAGRLLKASGISKILLLPESDVVLKYLERMDFFSYVGKYFSLAGGLPKLSGQYARSRYSDVLLEITPIEKSDDVHFIVGRIRERARTILQRHLHYEEGAVNGFIVSISEVCQNIIEHSEHTGYVGIQKYHFQRIGRNVVKIAVMDAGIGFRRSLMKRITVESDLEAIDSALFNSVSRYADPGRGHGLEAVRRFVNRRDGKLSIRSGRARRSVIPEWSWGKRKESGLGYFPGAQINIMLPEMQRDRGGNV